MKKQNNKNIQIGVIGSMLDKSSNFSLKSIAKELGKEIALNNAILLFGFEEDCDSISQIAAKSAKENNGNTIAFCYGKNKKFSDSIRIITGQERGGGREFSFILSCDVIIAVGGGSGTLMEIAIAYQQGIPVVALKKSGGWSEKLSNKFLDNRKRFKIISTENPKEAVKIAINLVKHN